MGTFGRLVFCDVRTQLVGETVVSRQSKIRLFYAHDDGGAVVVAAAAPGLGDKPRRELLRPFAAVLAQQLAHPRIIQPVGHAV